MGTERIISKIKDASQHVLYNLQQSFHLESTRRKPILPIAAKNSLKVPKTINEKEKTNKLKKAKEHVRLQNIQNSNKRRHRRTETLQKKGEREEQKRKLEMKNLQKERVRKDKLESKKKRFIKNEELQTQTQRIMQILFREEIPQLQDDKLAVSFCKNVTISLVDNLVKLYLKQDPDLNSNKNLYTHIVLGLPLDKSVLPETVLLNNMHNILVPVSKLKSSKMLTRVGDILYKIEKSKNPNGLTNGRGAGYPGFINFEIDNIHKPILLEQTTLEQREEALSKLQFLMQQLNIQSNKNLSETKESIWLTNYLQDLYKNIRGDSSNYISYTLSTESGKRRLPRFTKSVNEIAGYRAYGNRFIHGMKMELLNTNQSAKYILGKSLYQRNSQQEDL